MEYDEVPQCECSCDIQAEACVVCYLKWKAGVLLWADAADDTDSDVDDNPDDEDEEEL